MSKSSLIEMFENTNNLESIIIVGGGLSGLNTAYKLCKAGFSVSLIEKEKFLGGFATSFPYMGCKIDIGPHYLTLPKESEITSEIKEIVGDENLIEIPNIDQSHKAYFQGKHLDSYPSLYDVIFRSGTKFFLCSMWDFFITRLERNFSSKRIETSKNYLVSTYGKFLYNIWFKPYYTKIYLDQLPPKNIVIKQFPPLTFKKIISLIIKKRSSKNTSQKHASIEKNHLDCYFRYGMGFLIENLKKKIEENGGKIFLETNIKSIIHDNDKKTVILEQNNTSHKINANKIIYAISPRIAIRWFEIPKNITKLISKNPDALNSIMVFLLVDSPRLYDGWIINVYERDLIFARIAQQNFLSDSIAPIGKTLLSVEIKLSDNDPLWKLDESSLISRVKNDLTKAKILKGEKIEGFKLIKFRNLYPRIQNTSENDAIILSKFINSFKNEYVIGTESDFGNLVTETLENEHTKNIPKGRGGLYMAIENSNKLAQKIISQNKN